MITYPTSTEWVRNTKTGTMGKVICRYNRLSDGKAIVQVEPVKFHNAHAHWLAAHTEAA